MKRLFMLLMLLSACQTKSEVPSPGPSPQVATAPVAPTATPRPAPIVEKETPPAVADEDLKAEEREADPVSEKVTLKLNVSPPVKAIVMWGAKKVGQVTPSDSTLEIERPRSSGPLDLEIRAEGYLPHHTRLHTDRSDKVNVRLVRPAEAAGMSGYRPPAK
jgi:hypothetical protein